MEISWTDRVRHEEVVQRVRKGRNILHTIQGRKANWIGHIFCRNCLLKHVILRKIDGRIKVTGRRRRRCKQLLGVLKERIGYWNLELEAPDRTVCTSRFGGYGPVVIQTA
jgi:hypothetical protein